MLSIKSVNALSHYTDWTIAHVHAGALGWNGFMTFGMIYWLAPRLFQTKLLQPEAGRTCTSGSARSASCSTSSRSTSPASPRASCGGPSTPTGQLAYPDFVETTRAIIPMYWIRARRRPAVPRRRADRVLEHLQDLADAPGESTRCRSTRRPRLRDLDVHPRDPARVGPRDGDRLRQEARRLAIVLVAPRLGTPAGQVHGDDHARRGASRRCSSSCRRS